MTISNVTAAGEAVGIAGTGRMAQALGLLLRRNGVAVAAIAGRRKDAAQEAALFVGAPEFVAVRELPQHARRILIAVSDAAVAETGRELAEAGLQDGIVLHTCGAAGPEELSCLRGNRNAIGVLHPLQTAPTRERGADSLSGAAFAYAGDPAAVVWAGELVRAIGGRPLRLDATGWQSYHAAAVMACNYQVALVDAALELMGHAGVGRDQALDAMKPLVRATTENILATGPERALTGPIRRGDSGTVRRHRKALQQASPETRRLYEAAGLRTLQVALRAGLPVAEADDIIRALEEPIS